MEDTNNLSDVLLSPELLSHIFTFLDGKDLFVIQRVCQFWKQATEHPSLWKSLVAKQNTNNQRELPFWADTWAKVWKWTFRTSSKYFTDTEMKNEPGTLVLTIGSRYQGEWNNNKEEGIGRKTWSDGAIYDGEWKDGKFHGFGKHIWSSGSSYEGQWVAHKRNGKGKNIWTQNDTYNGEWLNDLKHGFGVYIWADGRKYEGNWKFDKRDGYGVFLWLNAGCGYEGEWKEDNRHGQGRFTWKDGECYEGTWFQGMRQGRGILKTKSGQIIQQEWMEITGFDVSNKGLCGEVKETQPVEPLVAEPLLLVGSKRTSENFDIEQNTKRIRN